MFSLGVLQDRFQHVVGIVFGLMFLPFWLQNPSQNVSKNLSKKTFILGSIFYRFFAFFGPSWRHLGSNLGHLGSILGVPRPANIGQDRYFSIFDPKVAPRAPRPLRTSIFVKFGGPFLIFHKMIFQRIRLQLLFLI